MTRLPPRQWYWKPIGLLVVGIAVAGFAFWRMIILPVESPSTNPGRGNITVEQPSCGNGVCEDVACLATNCPLPESVENCPQDCGLDDVGAGNNINELANDNLNTAPPSATDALDFDMAAQTLEEKNVCPVEEANLTPTEAANLARSAGLGQGIAAVEIRLQKEEPPLEQCVWTVKNYETRDSGNEYLIIDSTQEVWRKNAWKTTT